MSKINVSIVLFNQNITQLNKCLKSIEISKKINLITLIDNSKVPLDIDLIYKPHLIKIKYLFNNKNLGYGKAHNIAIKNSLESISVKYHLVINSDVFFYENVIDECFNYMEENKNVGNICPNILYPNNEPQYLAKLIPNPLDLVIRFVLPNFLRKKHDKKYLLKDFYDNKKFFFVPFLTGCFMFLRLSKIRKIGAFDERFFLYSEDIDLSRRIAFMSDQIMLMNLTIFHDHGRAYRKSFKVFIIMIINLIKYFNKWGWFNDKIRVKINKKAQKQHFMF